MWQVCNKTYSSAGLNVEPKGVNCIHSKVGLFKSCLVEQNKFFGKYFVIKSQAGRQSGKTFCVEGYLEYWIIKEYLWLSYKVPSHVYDRLCE